MSEKLVIHDRIGLLVVHGIGDQSKYEFLQSVGQALVKNSVILFGKQNVAVELLPGLDNKSDMSIVLKSDARNICVDISEVWWRDLGEETSIPRVVGFWFWAASFFGTRGRFFEPTHDMSPPQNWSAQHHRISIYNRFKLFIKITYFFIMLLPLRLILQLINIVPGIRRINLFRAVFSYMSSVQLYQQRRSIKGGTLVDFDQSRRISIQRRMANSLVSMSEKKYDRWYILAHSLGSVIAYKGLMYPDDAFARFMSLTRWYHPNMGGKITTNIIDDYPDRPKCPHWLQPNSGLDTEQIFKNLRGMITFGSPLETFANTWPAMVPVHNSPKLSNDFEWINLYDPIDIVASPLKSFEHEKRQLRPQNVACRASWWITAAHTSYLSANKRNWQERITPPILDWMLDGDRSFDEFSERTTLPRAEYIVRRFTATIQWLLVIGGWFNRLALLCNRFCEIVIVFSKHDCWT
jgi:hypothetical protein